MLDEKILNAKSKGKEMIKKAEGFVEDHSGLLMFGTLASFALGMFVVSNKQSKKFYENANNDIRMALMASLASNKNQ